MAQWVKALAIPETVPQNSYKSGQGTPAPPSCPLISTHTTPFKLTQIIITNNKQGSVIKENNPQVNP